jgi:hypothetical protein
MDKNEKLKNFLIPFAINRLCEEAKAKGKLKVSAAAIYGWLKGKPLAQKNIDDLEVYLIENYGYKPEKEDNLSKLLAMQVELAKMIEEEK